MGSKRHEEALTAVMKVVSFNAVLRDRSRHRHTIRAWRIRTAVGVMVAAVAACVAAFIGWALKT